MKDNDVFRNKLTLRFLAWFCPAHLYEEIEGDLIQKFERDVNAFGEKRAKRRLIWNTTQFFRPGIILRNNLSPLIRNSMIINHFLFASRLLSRNKAFALISIFGLSVSIAACVLVVEYADFELSYDKSFANHSRIYRLQHNRIVNREQLYQKAMSFPEVGLAMKEYFSEVDQVARLFPVSLNIEPVFTATMKSGEKKSFSEPDAYLTDSSFCKVFDLEFIHGSQLSALSGPDKIILSRSAALRYFGKLDVVGQTLSWTDGEVTVTGVFNDLPPNSHFKFDVLLSWFKVYGDRSRFTWDGFYNYFLLKEGTDVKGLTNRFPEFVQSYFGDYYKDNPGSNSQFELQPLETIHLDSHLDGEMQPNGNRNIVYALLIVAAFIIFIAVTNHVNLNTSQSLERIKEIGIRKSIGTTQAQLITQFLCESLLLNFLATAIGLSAAWLLYPSFNGLFNSHISLTLFSQGSFWIIMLSFIVLISIISGFYPAFMLTRFKVFEALKGITIAKRKSGLQWSLVTIQFTISLILIVSTYVLLEQINFMQTKDLGFSIEQKLVIKILPGHGDEGDSTFNQKMTAIKKEILSYPFCKSSTISSSIPGRKNEWRGSTRLSGADDDAAVIRANLTRVDEDFINTFDLHLLAGRNYVSSFNNESSIILNVETTRQLGFNTPEEALGKKVVMFRDREIIGVVESFHEAGLHEVLSPSLYITGEGYTKFLTISMTAGNTSQQIETISKIWRSQFPDKPFQYFFLDDFFNRQYQADVLMSRSISLFSGMAVVIACLGLFSLSAYTIYRKTKEIGIKKILGASVVVITKELCQNFMIPIGLSAVLGIPLSYYLVTWWLKQYAYRIDVTYTIFVVPLLILVVIGLLTIIFQSIKAASKNPVESLKYE